MVGGWVCGGLSNNIIGSLRVKLILACQVKMSLALNEPKWVALHSK